MDPLQSIVRGLRIDQLDALIAESGGSFSGREARMAAATTTGLDLLAGLRRDDPMAARLMDVVGALPGDDTRMTFLDAIPDGPVLSMMRALALEATIFGDASRDVAELSLLMGTFTLLLDGLLDEAPGELAPLAPWLDGIMRGQAWADAPLAPPPVEVTRTLHPVASLLVTITTVIIGRVTSHAGWGDPVVRAEFRAASRAAYEAELASVDLSLGREPSPSIHDRVVEKSTTCIWAGALLPCCVHGWPSGLDPRAFERMARAVGRLGGWVDDVVDVLEDVRGDRWSAVLLEMDAAARTLGITGTPHARLARALQSPFVARHLTTVGVERWRAVERALEAANLAPDAVVPAMADMAFACLTVDEPGTSAAEDEVA